jgi:CTP synthase (UTP-ammonia lyase)
VAPKRIALVGDHHPEYAAHAAIPVALDLARKATGASFEWEWLPSTAIPDDPAAALAPFDAVWCVPGSPYANTRGVLSAIRLTREQRRPFLGTCGGFQHAVLEYAEAVWGLPNVVHAELRPQAVDPLIAPLECALVEESGDIYFTPGSRLVEIYGAAAAFEVYHCRYGFNARYLDYFSAGALRVSGRDKEGSVRAVELEGHPFFFGTLFQPERSALTGDTHPLISAFIRAVAAR